MLGELQPTQLVPHCTKVEAEEPLQGPHLAEAVAVAPLHPRRMEAMGQAYHPVTMAAQAALDKEMAAQAVTLGQMERMALLPVVVVVAGAAQVLQREAVPLGASF